MVVRFGLNTFDVGIQNFIPCTMTVVALLLTSSSSGSGGGGRGLCGRRGSTLKLLKKNKNTQGFLPLDLFHSNSLVTWGSSGASKEVKFLKELTFLCFMHYFSPKIE